MIDKFIIFDKNNPEHVRILNAQVANWSPKSKLFWAKLTKKLNAYEAKRKPKLF